MSLPPPPGLGQKPSSLPPRPPSSSTTDPSSFKPAYSAAPSYSSSGTSSGYGGNTPRSGYSNTFTAFQPRSVASNQPYRTSSPAVSAPPGSSAGYPAAPPTTSYGGGAGGGGGATGYRQSQQSYPGAPSYYGQSQYNNGGNYGSTVPQIQNPFAPPTGSEQRPSGGYGGGRGRNTNYRNESGLDPETEAQIAQWQSAYASKEETAMMGHHHHQHQHHQRGPGRRDGLLQPGAGPTTTGTNTPTPAGSNTPVPVPGPAPTNTTDSKTVVRSGGGQTWTDSTLLEWDPAHFRLFVGNLAGEVTDDSLLKAFTKYTSVQKARVIRDKRTQKSKGFGFVSFSDGDDYFKAAREMQGKYIGSHPILLRRATTEVRPSSGAGGKGGRKHGGGRAGAGAGAGGGGGGGGGGAPGSGSGKTKPDGVKKPGKTKGGLKLLG
ncbi:hypothetical protein ASPZODRAFT_153081 [Penicilliopsis zonata CBS 506.65]|uniref:RRM domain-containing protein n=1 Tax=Penicilliopsis zonata CBS 506.65 TaxID=1073090 RepID=A0A1L9SE95_9EURO|nr:hypothetical protein ASPZODRAFT_153081 [Penicilliopsis zonata CBS 506.65]OJJ45428.1 hypothetical protein ASPZODRAFT_153081 [Penicilliopsis zonata CBS 506.65]